MSGPLASSLLQGAGRAFKAKVRASRRSSARFAHRRPKKPARVGTRSRPTFAADAESGGEALATAKVVAVVRAPASYSMRRTGSKR
jgi:hypothetical protein